MVNNYILTLSCPDKRGIVAAVSGFISINDGFIIESAQFGDASTGNFFLRMEFALDANSLSFLDLKEKFASQIAENFAMNWHIHAKNSKQKIMIMVSKYGHCLNDLLHRCETGNLIADIAGIISNHQDFHKIADWHKIDFHYLPVTPATKATQEEKLLDIINMIKPDLIVLARYMQILSPELSRKLYGKVINIHHSLLPGFKGAKPYQQAFDRGVKIIGATAHFVTEDLDEGPIIEQEVVRVDHSQKPSDLEAIGMDAECSVLARAIKYFIEQRVLINGNKTVVFK